MATLSHLLSFFFLLSFVLFLGYSSVPKYNTPGGCSGLCNQSQDAMTQLEGINSAMNNSIVINTGLPVLGTIITPNPFAIFYGVFQTLWSILTLPLSLFALGGGGIPPIIITGITGILILFLALTVLDWFRH